MQTLVKPNPRSRAAYDEDLVLWHATLAEQRLQLDHLLISSPSLRRKVAEYADYGYRVAVKRAAGATHLPVSAFPTENPYTVEQILDQEFTP